MNIQKNTAPIKHGQRYFLDLVAVEVGGECDHFALPSGAVLKLNKKSIAALWAEAQPINRCKDCKHLTQTPRKTLYCDEHELMSAHKLRKACPNFTPKEP